MPSAPTNDRTRHDCSGYTYRLAAGRNSSLPLLARGVLWAAWAHHCDAPASLAILVHIVSIAASSITIVPVMSTQPMRTFITHGYLQAGSWRPLTMTGNPGLPTFIAPMVTHIHLNPHRLGLVDMTLTPHTSLDADTILCTVAAAGSWR